MVGNDVLTPHILRKHVVEEIYQSHIMSEEHPSSNTPEGTAVGGIPPALRDFIFDLYDCVRTSQIPTEQYTLYTVGFRDLTAKVRYIYIYSYKRYFEMIHIELLTLNTWTITSVLCTKSLAITSIDCG